MWPFKKKVELGPSLRFAKACVEVAEEERLKQANLEKGIVNELDYSEMIEDELVDRFKLGLTEMAKVGNELVRRGCVVKFRQPGWLKSVNFEIKDKIEVLITKKVNIAQKI